MLRFNPPPRSRPPGTLSAALQLRLVLTVVALGFVIAVMSQLRTPQGAASLHRLLHGGQPLTPKIDPGQSRPAPSLLSVPAWLTDEQLAPIEDNTFFRREESEAWFLLFARLQTSGLADDPALGPLAYAQLTRQPDIYRGRPVRVAGSVRRIERVPAGPNNLGLESLYRMILQGQGGEAWPTTLYTLSPPNDAPLGELINLPVTATGVFFKNWSYRSQAGLGISPVLLASRVDPIATPTTTAKTTADLPPAWTPLIAAGIAGVVLLVVRTRLANPRPRAATPGTPPLDFTALAKQEPRAADAEGEQ